MFASVASIAASLAFNLGTITATFQGLASPNKAACAMCGEIFNSRSTHSGETLRPNEVMKIFFYGH